MPKQKTSTKKTPGRVKTTYNRQEAMELLGLRSTNTLLMLARRYPDAFVVMSRTADGHARYDKTLLDSFAEWRKRFREEQL